jgi:hypothetical protein
MDQERFKRRGIARDAHDQEATLTLAFEMASEPTELTHMPEHMSAQPT